MRRAVLAELAKLSALARLAGKAKRASMPVLAKLAVARLAGKARLAPTPALAVVARLAGKAKRASMPVLAKLAVLAPIAAAGIAAGPASGAAAAGEQAARIVAARYAVPTDSYPHGILGDAIEHQALEVTLSDGRRIGVRWSDGRVFEDTAPRLADLDGDGAPEVIVVETDPQRGARLAVWGLGADSTLAALAATPFIGTRFRWLAPVGAADLDGDGAAEIAYVDRPHLAKVLRVVRFAAVAGARPRERRYALTPVAALPGLTNHRIGDRAIFGGIDTCDGGPLMIVASADWSRRVAVALRDDRLIAADAGAMTDAPRC